MLVPSLVLGLGTMAFLTRLMRSSMLEIVNPDYVRTARAKGLPPTRIFLSHQLRNAILPVVTVLGPADRRDHDRRLRRRAGVRDPGPRALLRPGRAAARLHRDHGHDRVLRRVPRAHGDRGRSALRLRRSARDGSNEHGEARLPAAAFAPVTRGARACSADAALAVVLAGRVAAAETQPAGARVAVHRRRTGAVHLARTVRVARRSGRARTSIRSVRRPWAGSRGHRRCAVPAVGRTRRAPLRRLAARTAGVCSLAEPATTQAVRLVWTPDPQRSRLPRVPQHHEPDPSATWACRWARSSIPTQTSASRIVSISSRSVTSTRWLPLDADGVETAPTTPLAVSQARDHRSELAIAAGSVPSGTRRSQTGRRRARSPLHPFGTDYLGRDMLARLMYGARVSLVHRHRRAVLLRADRHPVRQRGGLRRRPRRLSC